MSARPPSLPPPNPPPSRRPAASAPPSPTSTLKAPPSSKDITKADAPPPPTAEQLAARNAAYALLGFTVITVLTLVAYFLRVDQPWGFESFVAMLSALLGSGATAMLWRQPTRDHALAGLIVMGVSILRVGLPTQWGVASVVVILVTGLLAVPIVQAMKVLPKG